VWLPPEGGFSAGASDIYKKAPSELAFQGVKDAKP